MSLPIFPANVRGLTYPQTKASGFNTILQSSPNFCETSIQQAQNPRWTWTFIYEYLKDYDVQSGLGMTYTDFRTLQGFLLSLGGSAGTFLYSDPTDNSVGPALNPVGGTPNLQAQLQVVNDGAGNYYSPIQRNVGGQFYEDITDLNGAITVYDNGTLKTLGTDYSVLGPGLALPGSSFMGMYLKWAGAPTGPVTVAFSFYFRCRVASDDAEFTRFMQSLYTYGGTHSSSGSTLDIRSTPAVQV